MPGRIPTVRPAHAADMPRQSRLYDKARQKDKNFYSSMRWRKLRSCKLSAYPLCETCKREGRVTLACHVHHVQPRKARPDLAHDPSNLQSICASCHNALDVR